MTHSHYTLYNTDESRPIINNSNVMGIVVRICRSDGVSYQNWWYEMVSGQQSMTIQDGWLAIDVRRRARGGGQRGGGKW